MKTNNRSLQVNKTKTQYNKGGSYGNHSVSVYVMFNRWICNFS
jgi:hypothetical protein